MLLAVSLGASSAHGSDRSATRPETINALFPVTFHIPMTSLIKNFNNDYPSNKIMPQYLANGNTYNQALLTQLQAGNPPDVFYAPGGNASVVSVNPLGPRGANKIA